MNAAIHIGSKNGLPPGSLVYIGKEVDTTNHSDITLVAVTPEHVVTQYKSPDLQALPPCDSFPKGTVFWYELEGVHDIEKVKELCDMFGIHQLVQEDIVNTTDRPKFEDYDDYLFFLMKNIHIDNIGHNVDSTQIAVLLGENWILSMRESTDYAIFSPIRQRLMQGNVRMRNFGPDFLLYSLLDLVVDRYFMLIDDLDNQFSLIESSIAASIDNMHPRRKSKMHHTELAQFHNMFKFKERIHKLQKNVRPLRDIINVNTLDESVHVTPQNLYYFKDLFDHVNHLLELTESLHEKTTDVRDLWMGMLSYRMNNVMQILAIMSSLFIPLTFIAGVYGMNFDNMPELKYHYSYFIVLGIMFATVIGMLFFFKRKQWF